MLRYHAVATNNARLLALTRLTRDEFTALVPTFETAFRARMQPHTIDGLPRRNRRATPYTTSPRPTPEDNRLCSLVHRTHHLTQAVHGQLVGMIPSATNIWLPKLRPVLLAALAPLDAVPSRLVAIVEPSDVPPSAGPFLTITGRSVQCTDP